MLHKSGKCPHPISDIHRNICCCNCQCVCYVGYEIRSSERLKKNITYLLKTDILTLDLKIFILSKVRKDLQNFCEAFWFNTKVNNEIKSERWNAILLENSIIKGEIISCNFNLSDYQWNPISYDI